MLRRRTAILLRPYLRSLSSTAGERSGPPPIQVAVTASEGRGVFATRAITAGELIHTAKPVIAHPSPSSPSRVCYYCLRKLGEGYLPGGDGTTSAAAYFCSDSCRENSRVFHEVERKADWSIYDDHCRARGLKYPFMAKRLACMVISGAASADILDILQPSILYQETVSEMGEQFELLKHTFMKAHIEESLTAYRRHPIKDPVLIDVNPKPRLTQTYSSNPIGRCKLNPDRITPTHLYFGSGLYLRAQFGMDLPSPHEWYIGVLARIRINAFRIELIAGSYEDLLASASASVSADAANGNAVYMLPSFYNHDCDPNAHIVWIDNADTRLKALRDIDAGEELRICYIDASMNYEARQSLLIEGFGFQCRCLRCSSGD